MSAPKKIRFGVLGCSAIAKKSAIPALVDSDLAELAAIGSRDQSNARSCAEQFGCNSYGTYEDVLADKSIEAIYISLPNSLHEEWTCKAAAAGKHVWCEKPAALTYASAKRMVAACKQKGVRLMEGFTFLYHPQHQKVKQLIEEGVLGDTLTFDGCFAYPMPDESSNRRNKNLAGGSYNDSTSYLVRASKMIFGEEPFSVACNLAVDPETQVDVKADMLMHYTSGRSAFLSSAFGAYFQSTYSVLGSRAHLKMERAYAVPKDRAVKIFLESDDRTKELSIDPADQFKLMVDDFCREIPLRSSSTKKYEDDLLSQARVLDAGRISHEEQRIVRISELA